MKKSTQSQPNLKFFLDESLPSALMTAMKKYGLSVENAHSAGLAGSEDHAIARHAKQQEAILVTSDLEFGSTLQYPLGSHHGLVVLRLPHYFNARQITETTMQFIRHAKREGLVGHLTILEGKRFRTRKMQ